jgi:peptidoglycan/LPS O-acetylase OafA/YrhL
LKSANLDLLRTIAVLAVYFSHLAGALHIWRMEGLGEFGVVLFFLHTCLVLNFSLERLELGGMGAGWRLVGAFWIRRIFRIYPLAIFFVLLTGIFRVPYSPGRDYVWPGKLAFLANLALVQNLVNRGDVLGTLWSLPIEVQMYVMLPFTYLAIRKRKSYGPALLWIAALGLALTAPKLSGRFGVFLYAPCFTAGTVAFGLCGGLRKALPMWIWPAGILTSCFLFGPFDRFDQGTQLPRAWILSLLLGVLVAFVRESEWRPLNAACYWIAEYSYGIYLSHFVVFWIALDLMAGRPVWERGLFLAMASVAIPIGCYHAIERPLIAVGSALAQRLKPKEGSSQHLEQPLLRA